MHVPDTYRTPLVQFVALVFVALFVLIGAPSTDAVSPPVEFIHRVIPLNHPSSDLSLVKSRLIFPPGSRWEIDPEAGPLTLSIEQGTLGVALGDGLARIERNASPMQESRIQRLEPNQMAVLWPGDTLVIVDGYRLHVDNDDAGIAEAMVSRVSQLGELRGVFALGDRIDLGLVDGA